MFVQSLLTQESSMNRADLRFVYCPKRDRIPRWLHRVWAWL
jgi:hypothetical protein